MYPFVQASQVLLSFIVISQWIDYGLLPKSFVAMNIKATVLPRISVDDVWYALHRIFILQKKRKKLPCCSVTSTGSPKTLIHLR